MVQASMTKTSGIKVRKREFMASNECCRFYWKSWCGSRKMSSSGCSRCQARLDKRLENNSALVGIRVWYSRYFFYSLIR